LNKLRAYALQDRGLDTVGANVALGFRDDEREYSIAAHMLHSLRIPSVRLLTNNPKKMEDLARYGIQVSARVPHVIPPNEFNRFYLETKRDRSGHLLDLSASRTCRSRVRRWKCVGRGRRERLGLAAPPHEEAIPGASGDGHPSQPRGCRLPVLGLDPAEGHGLRRRRRADRELPAEVAGGPSTRANSEPAGLATGKNEPAASVMKA